MPSPPIDVPDLINQIPDPDPAVDCIPTLSEQFASLLENRLRIQSTAGSGSGFWLIRSVWCSSPGDFLLCVRLTSLRREIPQVGALSSIEYTAEDSGLRSRWPVRNHLHVLNPGSSIELLILCSTRAQNSRGSLTLYMPFDGLIQTQLIQSSPAEGEKRTFSVLEYHHPPSPLSPALRHGFASMFPVIIKSVYISKID